MQESVTTFENDIFQLVQGALMYAWRSLALIEKQGSSKTIGQGKKENPMNP